MIPERKDITKKSFSDWGFYSVIFYIILLPFIAYGWLKILSVALVLGFFGGILNRFLREYYACMAYLENKEAQAKKAAMINRVTGEQPVWSNRTLRGPHEIDERPQGQRDPNQEK